MLVRTRPYRPPSPSARSTGRFDRAFEQLTSSFTSATPRTPVVDATWNDGDLELTVDLPGIAAEQVGVSVAGRTLTLSAHDRALLVGAQRPPRRRPRPRAGHGPRTSTAA